MTEPTRPNSLFDFRRIRTYVAGLWLLAAALTVSAASAVGADVVRVQDNPTRWTISTDNSSYQVVLTADKNLAPTWFGPVGGEDLVDLDQYVGESESGTILREIPYRGGFVEMTPAIEVVFPDGNRELELRFEGFESGEMDGFPFVRFDLADIYYPLTVSEYIRVFPDLDVYEKWIVLTNTGAEKILIENACSGSLLLPPDSYDLIHISGDWGREFIPRRTALTSGSKSLFIRTMKSQQHAPFFLVRPTGQHDEFSGPAWFGAVAWSGNWRIDCEVNRLERTQVSGGINFWDTTWNLEGGGSFETPKLVYGFSPDGPAGASRRLHRYALDHLMPKPFSRRPSRVLYNSWYATTFNVNEGQQYELARIARDIGVELFVIDDGWFRGRVDDRAGLGDWTPDPVKFPNGLQPLIRKINALGLDFGIWVEPEMVNPASDLCRAHPDWALHAPHRTAHLGRRQLVLNFARDDVKRYTIDWLDKLLTDNDIKFIKWDMNRHVSEAGWPEADPALRPELRIRYVRNLYDVLRTIRKKHPDVVFETCSGGGGRVNFGILALTDQFWTSDNTDPGDRLQIQYGFSYAFPAKTMVNWVTDDEWHRKSTSLQFRFHVAMAGNLGVGGDLGKWSEADRATAREMIALYKSVRHVIQLGDQYRLESPFDGNRTAIQFVTRDSSESVIFAFQTLETLPMTAASSSKSDRLVLHGLDPAGIYTISGDSEKMEIPGSTLMTAGMPVVLDGNYSSRVVVVHRER